MRPMDEMPPDIRQAFGGSEQFFACKEQFESFLRYLTGLIVASQGHIAAIADRFWEEVGKDPSHLHGFGTESDGEAEEVEAERLRRLKEPPVLKPSKAGERGIDDGLWEKRAGRHGSVGMSASSLRVRGAASRQGGRRTNRAQR